MTKKTTIDALRGYMKQNTPLRPLRPRLNTSRSMRDDEYCPECWERDNPGDAHPDKHITFCGHEHLDDYERKHPKDCGWL